jgi:UDP-glucose 4-epimerase
MKHSVVIGGAGFVGSWVVDEILKDIGTHVTIIDNLISSERVNISSDPRVKFIEGSAAELSTLQRITSPVDYVYQLACFHGNQSSITRPLEDLENGLKTTLVTLEWVKNEHPNARVIYSGAGCAVAEKTWEEPLPVEEVDTTSLKHDSPYSISKIAGEMYCLYYAEQQGLDVVRVRFQNVYGPREILGAGKWRGNINTIWRNVVPTFIFKALNNIDIEIYGENNASRDFIYVGDIAEGVVLAMKNGKSGIVYNLATGTETLIPHLAEIIINESNSNSKILNVANRYWDNSGRRLGSVEFSAEKLGFESKIKLKVGLKQTIDWTQSNINLIKENINKHKNRI